MTDTTPESVEALAKYLPEFRKAWRDAAFHGSGYMRMLPDGKVEWMPRETVLNDEDYNALSARLAEVEAERSALLEQHDKDVSLIGVKMLEAANQRSRADAAETWLREVKKIAADAEDLCMKGHPVSAYNLSMQIQRALPEVAEEITD